MPDGDLASGNCRRGRDGTVFWTRRRRQSALYSLPVCADDAATGYAELLLRGVQERLVQRTLDARGTVTGEHGVGYGKMELLPRQYGEGAVEAMRSVKRALDPRNI